MWTRSGSCEDMLPTPPHGETFGRKKPCPESDVKKSYAYSVSHQEDKSDLADERDPHETTQQAGLAAWIRQQSYGVPFRV
jgi:hypothetical protein